MTEICSAWSDLSNSPSDMPDRECPPPRYYDGSPTPCSITRRACSRTTPHCCSLNGLRRRLHGRCRRRLRLGADESPARAPTAAAIRSVLYVACADLILVGRCLTYHSGLVVTCANRDSCQLVWLPWCASNAGRSERMRGMRSKLRSGGGLLVAHSRELPWPHGSSPPAIRPKR
jgi:hypothetical protein